MQHSQRCTSGNAATSIPAVDNDTKAIRAGLMTYHNWNLRQHSVSLQLPTLFMILTNNLVFSDLWSCILIQFKMLCFKAILYSYCTTTIGRKIQLLYLFSYQYSGTVSAVHGHIVMYKIYSSLNEAPFLASITRCILSRPLKILFIDCIECCKMFS